ncbi:lytic transglycosylase [Nitritalea halalkaliphila LW7]|uniref:Lytic transglycosylase n=1 Tax=Nitritalea halalkaliphila LW7 TaxID=1189621 RepID=I5C5P9_9BACT|nr:lytic transglycosylase domain-containing protein [Nitritalea halalkaliphila]EIM77151.1 lytic transglycosylase [Nitritalea halalkaliphila LW7]
MRFNFHLIFLYLAVGGLLVLQFWPGRGPVDSPLPEDYAPYAVAAGAEVAASGGLRAPFALLPLPEELDFAGERVPLEDLHVRERMERELYVNAYWESNLILLKKRSAKYLPEIERLLAAAGVPDDFKYVAIAESALLHVTSPAGARGFWQFMPKTAKEYGLEVSSDVDERYHLEKATLAAARYLKKAHARFGTWAAVAASYNMGQAGLANRMQEQRVNTYFDLYLNDETSRYLFRVLAFKLLFEQPETYGYFVPEAERYRYPETRTLRVDTAIPDLAVWAQAQGSTYRDLKWLNPWLRSRKLAPARGKTYEIKLPVGSA